MSATSLLRWQAWLQRSAGWSPPAASLLELEEPAGEEDHGVTAWKVDLFFWNHYDA
jgi:hypothetical protein